MNKMRNKQTSDYDRLTPKRWDELVGEHVDNLKQRVNRTVRQTVREYLLTVFIGAEDTELKFIGDVLDRLKNSTGVDLDLDRKDLPSLLKTI